MHLTHLAKIGIANNDPGQSRRVGAPVAQWIEHRTSNPTVAGSNPAGRAIWGFFQNPGSSESPRSCLRRNCLRCFIGVRHEPTWDTSAVVVRVAPPNSPHGTESTAFHQFSDNFRLCCNESSSPHVLVVTRACNSALSVSCGSGRRLTIGKLTTRFSTATPYLPAHLSENPYINLVCYHLKHFASPKELTRCTQT